MWSYEKRLQYPVNITTPNAKLAEVIISQYGGPDGEMGASMRYLSQRYGVPYPEIAAVLTDIGVSVPKLRIWHETCNIKCLSLIGSLLTDKRMNTCCYKAKPANRDEASAESRLRTSHTLYYDLSTISIERISVW